MSDGALTAREAGEIITKLDLIGDRLDRIDERLDAGDKRFRAMDLQAEADGVIKRLAIKVGGWVLGVLGAIGLAVMSHIPAILEWFVPPKH